MRYDTNIEGKELLTPVTVEEATAFYEFMKWEFIPHDDKFVALHAFVQRVGEALQRGERFVLPVLRAKTVGRRGRPVRRRKSGARR